MYQRFAEPADPQRNYTDAELSILLGLNPQQPTALNVLLKQGPLIVAPSRR
jgi:hypothetical protein